MLAEHFFPNRKGGEYLFLVYTEHGRKLGLFEIMGVPNFLLKTFRMFLASRFHKGNQRSAKFSCLHIIFCLYIVSVEYF